MEGIKDTNRILKISLLLSIAGLIIPNGIFIYYFFTDHNLFLSALRNPVSLVFLAEAFILMFYFSWLLSKLEDKPFTGFMFILLSIIGSLGFSVPYFIYRLIKQKHL